MIVPNLKFLLAQLLTQLLVIDRTRKGRKYESRWAFNHRLTLTVKRKDAVVALVSSKLFSNCNNFKVFTISDKDSWLDRPNENEAVFSVIDIDVCCDIEDEVGTVFAVVDVILLFFDRIDFFNFERVSLIDKPIIVRVVFLFRSLRFQDKIAQSWLRLLFFFNRLNFLRFFDQLLPLRFFRLYFFKLFILWLSLWLCLLLAGIESIGCFLNGWFFMILSAFIVRMNLISKYTVISILRRGLSDPAIFYIKSFLMHVVSKVFILFSFRAGADVSHSFQKDFNYQL